MRLIFSFFLFCLLSTFCPAQKTVVEWLTPVHYDFGDIKQGNPVTFEFKYKNSTQEAFIIDNVRTSCGCTAPEWSDLPTESGDSQVLKVVYDAKKAGYFYKKIKVFFSTQRKAELLTIEGYVGE